MANEKIKPEIEDTVTRRLLNKYREAVENAVLATEGVGPFARDEVAGVVAALDARGKLVTRLNKLSEKAWRYDECSK